MMRFGEQQPNKTENKEAPHLQTVEVSAEQIQNPEEYSQEKIASIQHEQTEIENNGNAEMNRLQEQYKPGSEVTAKYQSKVDELMQKGRAEASQAMEKITKVVQSEEFNMIADATPFAGGAKQTIEGISGKTLSGEELHGTKRVLHTAKGVGSLALDLSGIGEVEKGARLAHVGEKVAEHAVKNSGTIVEMGKKSLQENTTSENAVKEKAEPQAENVENNKYREKIKNPELIQAIDENSTIVNAELDEFDKNATEKLSAREEKLRQRESELRAYMSGKGEALRNKRHLQEEISGQELRVSGGEQKIKDGEQRLQSLDDKIPPTSQLRAMFEKLRGPKKQEVDFMQESEKRKLESLNGNLSQTNEKLDTVYSAKNADTALESAFNEWQKSLSYETMTEDNPEYKEKMDAVVEKYLGLFEERDLKKEGIDKETIREEFSQIAGDLVYGKQNEKKFDPIKNMETKDLPSMEANAYAMGIKDGDVDKLLAVQAKLNGAIGQNELYDRKDFDIAKHRTYYEARRTAENVFTHVVHPDAIEAVMKSHNLKSSLKFRSEGGERNSNVADTAEENVFLTSGGGGYKNYGGKNFAFFATTGQNILESGKSISVASPSLKEQGEYGKGRELGEYESANGAEMPIDNMVFVTRESQIPKYLEMFKQNGYSQKWIDAHVIGIPEDVVQKMETIENVEEADSMLRKEFINKKVKGVLKDGKSDESLYLTTTSRTPKHGGDGRIYKWEKAN